MPIMRGGGYWRGPGLLNFDWSKRGLVENGANKLIMVRDIS